MVGLTVGQSDRPDALALELTFPINGMYSGDLFASQWAHCVAEVQLAVLVKFDLRWTSRTTAVTTSAKYVLHMDPGHHAKRVKVIVDVDSLVTAGDDKHEAADAFDLEDELEKIIDAGDVSPNKRSVCKE